jgi:hypothetical protein
MIKLLQTLVKIVTVVVGLFIAIVTVFLAIFMIAILINEKMTSDLIEGKTGDIGKIVIKKFGKEHEANDLESMEYFKKSFKTFKKTDKSFAGSGEIYIYIKNRPTIVGALFIANNNSEKGYLWVDDERREAFEFDLPKPHPEGVRRIIDFVTERRPYPFTKGDRKGG